MKKSSIIAIILIILIVLGGLTLMAAYASPIELEDPQIWLYVEDGEVFYKDNASDYIKAYGAMQLQSGYNVKTNDNSVAKIVFYDTQELILDEETEITITQSMIDENSPFLTKVKINLNQGQVWSRLLEMFHPESLYEIEAENVVATVRGTSFNMSNISDQINVSVFENAVEVTDQNEKVVLNVEDFLAVNKTEQKNESADIRSSKFTIRKVKAEEKKLNWIKKNIERDENFKQELIQRRKRLFNQIGPLPGEKAYRLKKLGEKIAYLTAFDQEKKDRIRKSIAVRRVLEAEQLLELGQKSEALRLIDKINLDLDNDMILQLQRIKSMDPEFKQRLQQDKELQNIYLEKILDSKIRDNFRNLLNQVNTHPRYTLENAEKYLDDTILDDIRENLIKTQNRIKELNTKQKDYLLDLETMEKNIQFRTDKGAEDFKYRAEELRKQLFETDNNLQTILEQQRYLMAELSKMQEIIEYNLTQIKEARLEIEKSLDGLAEDLEIVKGQIDDLGADYGFEVSTGDELQLLDVPMN